MAKRPISSSSVSVGSRSFEISQAHIDAALKASKMGIWEWDLTTDRVVWSEESYRIFGIKAGDFDGTLEGYLRLIHPDDLERLRATIAEALSNDVDYHVEHRVVWPNGEVHWITATGSKIMGGDGRPLKLTGTACDITSLKKSERENEELEMAYKTLFSSSPDAIFVLSLNDDNTGSIVSANEAAAMMHGYTMEEFLKLNISDIDTPESLQKAIDNRERVLRGERFIFELNHVRKDGSIFPVEVSAGYYEANGRRYLIVIDRDISTRKTTEEALRESEQRFRLLQEASFGGIAIHDQGVILDANQGLSRLMGYSLDELIGMNGMALLPESERAYVMNKVKEGYELPYDSIGLRKDGSQFDMEIRGSNVPYKGKMVRITEFRDVTDRKQAEEHIREQNERLLAIAQNLRRKNEQLQEFTQIVSHNLRSPVGNINSLIELMEGHDGIEDVSQYVSLLKQSAGSLLVTLNELNEVLQIKQNRNIEKQEIVFADVFMKVSHMLNAHINELRAMVTCDFGEVRSIWYPNIYMESIFLNLLSNALKYHHPERAPVIRFKTYKTGNEVLLEVSDNGLGINLAKHGHQVFKLHKTFHKHPESKGIGLFMIKNQIETMGGEIDLQSKEGEGTVFTINFNKHQDP